MCGILRSFSSIPVVGYETYLSGRLSEQLELLPHAAQNVIMQSLLTASMIPPVTILRHASHMQRNATEPHNYHEFFCLWGVSVDLTPC